jgi:aspartyl-tRNA(Asn)/glutamyl-tRNA(Gln) amidotransferase subunit A
VTLDIEELPYLSVGELAPLIRTKDVSPVTIADAVLERIEKLDPLLHAYITVEPESVRRQAKKAEGEILAGNYIGPLHGVPIAHKDTIWTKGLRTTGHSKLFADFVPLEDATAVRRLGEAGAVTIGKANTHEFACGEMGLFGVTRNIWDLDRVTGGSSSGSALVVAAHLAIATTGSDGGGSIRVPAAFCGVVGLKPTYGRVSRFGNMPLSWSMSQIGPMTKTVHDAALMLRVMAGYDPRDATTSHQAVPDYVAALDGDIRGLRLGVPREYYFEDLDPDVATCIEESLRTLENLGAKLEEVRIPWTAESVPALYVITFAEAASIHENDLRNRPHLFGKNTYHRLAQGLFFTAVEYVRAMRVREALNRGVQAIFDAGIKGLVYPVAPYPAYPASEFVELEYDDGRLTRLANLTGLPSISIPCGFSRHDLPIGLQITGSAFDEATVLRVAHAYEQATTWHSRRAPEPDLRADA